MKYCSRCILPESYPGISFNSEGLCNYCQEQQHTAQVHGRERLVEVLDSRQNKGTYDCGVPMSGGKDSSYILYYTVKELGLRPLVVSYNSGYQTKKAEDNVRNACEILGVPFEVIKSPGRIQTELLRTSYKLSKKMAVSGDLVEIVRRLSGRSLQILLENTTSPL